MSIALSLGNNLTTGGIFKPTAVNNTSVNNVTDFAGIAGGGTLVLLSTQTASASASISFTTGIDSTYDEYIFKIINCHPSVNNARLQFNLSTDGGSNYNVVKTSTYFATFHDEADGYTALQSESLYDGFGCNQYSGYQEFGENVGANNSDECISGELKLFAPSSTTFVKHYLGVVQLAQGNAYSKSSYINGYGNTTSAVNAIDFKFSSGNIDDGIIKMYGVAKS